MKASQKTNGSANNTNSKRTRMTTPAPASLVIKHTTRAIVLETNGLRKRDVHDETAELERAESDAHHAALARRAQQIADEAPAWRRITEDGVVTLRTLIARAVGGSEDGNAVVFEHGALRQLAEDLTVLYNASLYNEGTGEGLPFGDVRHAIWRLSERAHALVELSVRFSTAEIAAVKPKLVTENG